MKKNAPTAKRLASGSKDTKNPNAIAGHKKKDEAEAALQATESRRGVSAQTREKAFAAGALVNKGPAAGRRLVMTSIQGVHMHPHPMMSPFQQQRFLTSAASVTAPSTRSQGCGVTDVIASVITYPS